MVTLKLTDATGAPSQHTIKIGDLVQTPGKKNAGERYAQIDKQDVVVVLTPELSKHLTARAAALRRSQPGEHGGARARRCWSAARARRPSRRRTRRGR